MAVYSDRDGTLDEAPLAVLMAAETALARAFPPAPEREVNPLRLHVWRTMARARGEGPARGEVSGQ